VIGGEGAGTIISLPTDAEVVNNEEYKKRGFKVGGKVALFQQGAFSEYTSVPWANVFPVPESVSLVTAAASLTQGPLRPRSLLPAVLTRTARCHRADVR